MNEADKKKGFFEKLKKTYRMSVVNNDTFEELSSFRFNFMAIIMAIFGALVLFAVMVFLMISYTPLRYYVPGYGSIHSDRSYIAMKQRLDEMEEYISDVEIYTNNMKKMLTDDAEYAEDVITEHTVSNDEVTKVKRIPEDDLLRSKVDINKDLIMIAKSSGVSSTEAESMEEMYLIPPVKGIISAAYDESRDHYGIDIIAPKDESIKAVAAGVVFLAESSIETGKTIGIQHHNDLVTYYKHNSSLLKKVGEQVQEGEAIAIIGNTGVLTDGPHLHFEMWYKGKSLNPARYIETLK